LEKLMPTLNKIVPCLWFDSQAEAAANFYVSVFKNSKIKDISRYTEAGRDVHQQKPGSVMTVAFELDGQPFTALNAGPLFKFSEAISFQVQCDTQDEIDYFWQKLSEGGDPHSQACGWLKDKFSLSWQIIPRKMAEFFTGDVEKAKRTMDAMHKMKKLDIATLQQA
jgi:predicted 3-demethylubiquinone-9 3-methyltransferase (glyoxalase superfamily)